MTTEKKETTKKKYNQYMETMNQLDTEQRSALMKLQELLEQQRKNELLKSINSTGNEE